MATPASEPSLLAIRANNVSATETTRTETKGGVALVQAKIQEGGNMKFPDHASYIQYLKGRAKLQGRIQRG